MKDHIIVFTAKEKAEFLEQELDAELTGDEILVKDDYDLISAGTELANYHALPNTRPIPRDFPPSWGTAPPVTSSPSVPRRSGSRSATGWS